jgi:hypothetical protein
LKLLELFKEEKSLFVFSVVVVVVVVVVFFFPFGFPCVCVCVFVLGGVEVWLEVSLQAWQLKKVLKKQLALDEE